jgi:NAD(P)-dependent dehydrogenase (short-subunit alcohol dehydrogenase family)
MSSRSVIVTGGCSGIGLAIARHFISKGHRVTILDVVPKEKGQETAEALSTNQAQVKAFYRKCNVASWDEQAAAFKEVYERNGSIDIVMANAGISERGATSAINLKEDAPSKPRLEVLDVNLSGVIYCMSSSFLFAPLRTQA